MSFLELFSYFSNAVNTKGFVVDNVVVFIHEIREQHKNFLTLPFVVETLPARIEV